MKCSITICRCDVGYVGDPLREGDYCQPAGTCNCDSRGSYSTQCDANDNCQCKVRTLLFVQKCRVQ